MRTDYIYCANENSCIHRGGCKRWLGNYTDEAVKELYTQSRFVEEVDDIECMREDYEYDNVKSPYDMLERLRHSDGSSL
jgi:hypothetical protein